MKSKLFILIFVLSINLLFAQVPSRKPNESTKDFANRVFPVGTRVLARFVNKQTNIILKYWYLGTVTSVSIDGSKVSVKFDDGDKQDVRVSSSMLQPFISFSTLSSGVQASYQGKKVLARYYDSGYNKKFWYSGYANVVKSGVSVYVIYDDGSQKTHTNLETVAVTINY